MGLAQEMTEAFTAVGLMPTTVKALTMLTSF